MDRTPTGREAPLLTGLRIVGLEVARGGTPVLHGVDLAVAAGGVTGVIGPSGAGKTTLLRAVAGLEPVDAGRIVLDGRDLTGVAPHERGISMVFDGAPLHPQLDVRGNLELPLRFRGTPPDEVDRRVNAEARAFSLSRLLRRLPRQLSLGERQTTATARSLVGAPRLLLLDEPLSGVDERGRGHALRELATVQSGYGLTTLLVSNDQRVAATLADHVVVLRAGRVEQAGTVTELFEAPATTFVAGFLGDPPMNLLRVRVEPAGHRTAIVHGRFRRETWDRRAATAAAGTTLGIRPEHLAPAPTHRADVIARVRRVELLGSEGLVRVDVGGSELVARLPRPLPGPGDELPLRATRLYLFSPDGIALGEIR